MRKALLTSRPEGPRFEFVCVTMPWLEPPLKESGYGPALTQLDTYLKSLRLYRRGGTPANRQPSATVIRKTDPDP